MNTSRIPKIESTGDIGIRSIKLVLRKNKFNEYRLSPVHEEEPFCFSGPVCQPSTNAEIGLRALKRQDIATVDHEVAGEGIRQGAG